MNEEEFHIFKYCRSVRTIWNNFTDSLFIPSYFYPCRMFRSAMRPPQQPSTVVMNSEETQTQESKTDAAGDVEVRTNILKHTSLLYNSLASML